MKVAFNTTNALQQRVPALKQKNDSTSQPQSYLKELARFNSVGMSMVSFKGQDDSMDLHSKTIEQLLEMKKLYQASLQKIEPAKAEAQAKIDKMDAWNWGDEYSKQKQDAENEINNGYSTNGWERFWECGRCKEIREKHYNAFKRKEREIDSLKENRGAYETIINNAPLNSGQVKKLIEQIDLTIKQKEEAEKLRIRLEGIDGVQKTINAMQNAEGGMNDRIAGYEYEKDQINKIFVEPLAKSIDNPKVNAPAVIMLHGATGTGKTAILDGIADQSEDFVKVVDASLDVTADNFFKEFNKYFEEARNRYLNKGKRTILLMNDAEQCFSMTPAEAKALEESGPKLEESRPKLFDEVDYERMENYGHHYKEINEFKSILDTCSKPPQGPKDTSRAALSIFITTNYPHIIHRDLLGRKIPYIAINPARNQNIEAVVKHYFKFAAETIDKIKTMNNPDDIDHLVDISRKAKENLKEMIKNGTISRLKIDYKNIPYDKMAKFANPTEEKGAFNNKQYKDLATTAFNAYLEDPSTEFYTHFTGILINAKRYIEPSLYRRFNSIYNMLTPPEKGEKEKLILQETMGGLDEKARKRLEYIRIQDASELHCLEEKEQKNILSEEDKKRLEELRMEKSEDTSGNNENQE